MKLSPEIRRTLKKNKEHGDTTRISEKTGLSIRTIDRAFNEGKASQATLDKIVAYFQEKREQKEKITTKVIDALN